MSAEQARILVIRGGAIGDFILTLPVLSALRAQFPQVRLEVLGYAHIAQLAVAGGLADDVRSIEAGALASFFAKGGALPAALGDYFARFAILISFLYDPDGIFQENIARCSKAQFIQGPHRPVDTEGIHATDVFLRPLVRLAIFDADPVPRLGFAAANGPAQTSEPSATAPTGLVALHPGSGSPRKNWPEERWADLIDHLVRDRDQRVLLVGGEAEGDRIARLAQRAGSMADVAFGLPLPELARKLEACRFFVGHDSGITHLAAAIGLEGLAIWGETAESVWSPRSPRMSLLRAGPELQQLPMASVAALIPDFQAGMRSGVR